MATSGTPIGLSTTNQALVKRSEHMGQTAVTGQTRKADGTTVEERRDEVTLTHQDHEQNAAHVGLSGQQGAKETRREEKSNLPARVEAGPSGQAQQAEAEVLDPQQLGEQLFQLIGASPQDLQEAFKAEGKAMMAGGMPSVQAAGQAAVNVTTGQLNQLEGDLSTNLPESLRKSESFAQSLKGNFEADRASGKQTPAFDILRQTASQEVQKQLASDPDNAELKAYGDKLTQYSLLDQVNRTGRDLLYSVGVTPAGSQVAVAGGNGGGVVPAAGMGVVPAGPQGLVSPGAQALQGPGSGPQVLSNAAGLLSAPGGGGAGTVPPAGGGAPPPGGPGGPGGPGSVPPPGGPGSSAFVPPGGSGGGPGGPAGPGGPGGPSGPGPMGPGPAGPGAPGGPTMSAADQARRMQQILQDQESARDIWMQIWAERQKHEAERWKIMKETMDYWMKTFQESTVNQAMTMQRVNEMWHQYFRS